MRRVTYVPLDALADLKLLPDDRQFVATRLVELGLHDPDAARATLDEYRRRWCAAQ